MDKKTFNNFSQFIYDASGITLGEKKEALLIARIGKRMRALGIDNHKEYYDFVVKDKDGSELIKLLDAISTNVTHFFREPQHFDFLRDAFAGWIQHDQKKYRIWCAASSSGEEPYSIAITFKMAAPENKYDFKVLATDISTKVLEMGKKALYADDKIKNVPPNIRAVYFSSKIENGKKFFMVNKEIQRLVHFARLNLSKPPFPMNGPFDAIFIRNVMIYFDNNVRKQLLLEAYRLLKKGGYLFVGHAESLTGLLNNNFIRVDSSVYKK